MNSSLSEDARQLHHNCAMAFGAVSSSRASMAGRLQCLLRVKTRFCRLSGVRFHQTSQNSFALIMDENECRLIGKLEDASDHAKAIASMMDQPNWATILVEACVPLLLWTVKLKKLLKVSLIEKTT